MPITIAIVVVLAIVVISYQPDDRAPIPTAAARTSSPATTLGRLPGLTAAAALLTDYVLTVAVSIAAGVAALTSVFPELFD